MIDISIVSHICNILRFVYGIARYIWTNRKKVSHLLQQIADKLCDLSKR